MNQKRNLMMKKFNTTTAKGFEFPVVAYYSDFDWVTVNGKAKWIASNVKYVSGNFSDNSLDALKAKVDRN